MTALERSVTPKSWRSVSNEWYKKQRAKKQKHDVYRSRTSCHSEEQKFSVQRVAYHQRERKKHESVKSVLRSEHVKKAMRAVKTRNKRVYRSKTIRNPEELKISVPWVVPISKNNKATSKNKIKNKTKKVTIIIYILVHIPSGNFVEYKVESFRLRQYISICSHRSFILRKSADVDSRG